MSGPPSSSAITCQFGAVQSADVDLLRPSLVRGRGPLRIRGLDGAAAGEISRALSAGEFTGRPFELFVTPLVDRAWKPRRVALIGAGQERRSSRPRTSPRHGGRARTGGPAAWAASVSVMRPGQAAPSGDIDVAGFCRRSLKD